VRDDVKEGIRENIRPNMASKRIVEQNDEKQKAGQVGKLPLIIYTTPRRRYDTEQSMLCYHHQPHKAMLPAITLTLPSSTKL
jgi:hypothetical protein